MAATLHADRFDTEVQRPAVEAYNRARAAAQPYAAQRYTEDFGAFVRAKGFKLD